MKYISALDFINFNHTTGVKKNLCETFFNFFSVYNLEQWKQICFPVNAVLIAQITEFKISHCFSKNTLIFYTFKYRNVWSYESNPKRAGFTCW